MPWFPWKGWYITEISKLTEVDGSPRKLIFTPVERFKSSRILYTYSERKQLVGDFIDLAIDSLKVENSYLMPLVKTNMLCVQIRVIKKSDNQEQGASVETRMKFLLTHDGFEVIARRLPICFEGGSVLRAWWQKFLNKPDDEMFLYSCTTHCMGVYNKKEYREHSANIQKF